MGLKPIVRQKTRVTRAPKAVVTLKAAPRKTNKKANKKANKQTAKKAKKKTALAKK